MHELFSEIVGSIDGRNPSALVVAHPECEPAVLQHAHHVVHVIPARIVARSENDSFIVLTEAGILHEMAKRAPGKLIPDRPLTIVLAMIVHMKLNTLEKLVACLETRPQIDLSEGLIEAAELPIRRMLARPERLTYRCSRAGKQVSIQSDNNRRTELH